MTQLFYASKTHESFWNKWTQGSKLPSNPCKTQTFTEKKPSKIHFCPSFSNFSFPPLPPGEDALKTTRFFFTVAEVSNLTLMALGSSAPEILLSIIELHLGGVGCAFSHTRDQGPERKMMIVFVGGFLVVKEVRGGYIQIYIYIYKNTYIYIFIHTFFGWCFLVEKHGDA